MSISADRAAGIPPAGSLPPLLRSLLLCCSVALLLCCSVALLLCCSVALLLSRGRSRLKQWPGALLRRQGGVHPAPGAGRAERSRHPAAPRGAAALVPLAPPATASRGASPRAA